MNPFRVAGGWAVSLACISALCWAIIAINGTWHRGIYAGFHYKDAKQYVREVTSWNLGYDFSRKLRMGVPDVKNTHAVGTLFGGSGSKRQIRVFHLLGPRGVRWCVSVWDGARNWNQNYEIQKGCTWSA